ncbi:MAG TPA: hypothetical protein VJU59_11010 [Paraburkholderia sp.]|uniref:hypothetical protein n=1 Tax=Paraburkholderia sp. TaxID=1926495 RepID=UPI002B4736E4|nr:hypothetical protein [Paraburkholderia sp.]HKR40188.1 hypothetical protein [Paraburkholderia sp.]
MNSSFYQSLPTGAEEVRSGITGARRRNPYIKPTLMYPTPPVSEPMCEPADDKHAALIARTDLRFLELPRPFATPHGVELPAFDEYGWEMGESYEAMLEARKPSLATRAAFHGIHHERRYEALALTEFGIQLAMMFNPYVLDFREQYGIYTSAAYWRARARGKRLHRSQMTTIDIVVTYARPPHFELQYHAISVKSREYEPNEKDKRREIKERTLVDERGWTWELMRSNAVPDQEVNNYVFLWTLIRMTSVRQLYEQSRQFARDLITHSTRGSLHSVLERRARGFGISTDMAYRLFASGVSYGFLTLDHSKRLGQELPLALRD